MKMMTCNQLDRVLLRGLSQFLSLETELGVVFLFAFMFFFELALFSFFFDLCNPNAFVCRS